MSDIVERLREPLTGNEERVMKTWDNIRRLLIVELDRGSYPRDIFESLLSDFDEEREEAADEIASLRQQLSEVREMASLGMAHGLSADMICEDIVKRADRALSKEKQE